jgi:AbiV family abortive infection protein
MSTPVEGDANEQTLIIENAARLLDDARFLAEKSSFASAYALAVIGVEEIGKAILSAWETVEPLLKPKGLQTFHLRKQAAVGSVLLALYAVKEFGDVMDGKVPLTDSIIASTTKAFNESEEGQFFHHIESGTFEKRKHLAIYRDQWLTPGWLNADQFDQSHVDSILEIARLASVAIADARTMHIGRAIYQSKTI